MKTVRIVIFARAPAAGSAKTRLIPALGAAGAARLARRMLVSMLDQAVASNVGPVELCVTPDRPDGDWDSFTLPAAVTLSAQGKGDLGIRMARAARRIIGHGDAVLLIGTDAPDLNATRLREAAARLRTTDATLIPVADGGYVLLGLNRFDPLLFHDMPWGTAAVASTTLSRIDQLGWSVHTGPVLHDIDSPEDLQWLPTEWRPAIAEQRAEPAANGRGAQT